MCSWMQCIRLHLCMHVKDIQLNVNIIGSIKGEILTNALPLDQLESRWKKAAEGADGVVAQH